MPPYAPSFEPSTRLLTIATPLGADKFLVEEFDGEEGLSMPFEFRVALLSEDDAIDPRDLIGEGVAITLRDSEGGERVFHGRAVSFSQGSYHERGLRRYEAVIRPWLWLLSKRKNCRIFQERSVIEIVSDVFEAAGFDDFELALQPADHQRLEYCVQYGESDLDFVMRLLEEHGVYYYFKHEATRHVMVLADGLVGYRDSVPRVIPFESGSSRPNTITSWGRRMQFVSGKWTRADYNYLAPSVRLVSESPSIVELPANRSFEQFEYPGRHRDAFVGDQKTRTQMEAEEATYETIVGGGNYLEMRPGGVFEVADPNGERDVLQGGRFLVTKVYHVANEESLDPRGASGTSYANEFECIPSGIVFKPRPVTKRPRVHGPQTAIVVGPEGETIFTDKYGRVKVRFHWDRSGSPDENSSCWIRVAQPWAGKNFGGLVLPRVGHEVVVEFLDGDPDRPLINGSVFNAANLPPQNLPADKAKMTIRSNSIDGVGSNEITMADSGGKEGFYVHAQYDFEEVVEHDRTSSVGNDQSHSVGNNQATSIANDQEIAVGNNRSLSVVSDSSVSIGANESKTIGASSVESAANDKTIQAGSNVVIDAGASLTLRCGAASITLDASGSIAIAGTNVTVAGAVMSTVSAPITTISGAAAMTVNGAVVALTGVETRVTGSSSLEQTGGEIKSSSSGEHVIQGSVVKIN